jgi:hypothetical protein
VTSVVVLGVVGSNHSDNQREHGRASAYLSVGFRRSLSKGPGYGRVILHLLASAHRSGEQVVLTSPEPRGRGESHRRRDECELPAALPLDGQRWRRAQLSRMPTRRAPVLPRAGLLS